MVAITSGCNNSDPWAAVVIGIIGALFYKSASFLLKKYEIDDVVDAYPIHLANGIWGTISPGFFDKSNGIFYGFGGL